MFYHAYSFNQDLSNWDVSRVTDMTAMFSAAKSFNQDLSNWDVSRVVDMQLMFIEARSFQQTLCGAAWVNSKASKVDMFTRSPGSISDTVCVFSPRSRDELKRAVIGVSSEPTMEHGLIGKWDVSQVTDMSTIFYEIDTFNHDLSNWDVSRVTSMFGMFRNTDFFNQDLSSWDVSRVASMFG